MYVNIRKKAVFQKRDIYSQENPERYVTPMVGAF